MEFAPWHIIILLAVALVLFFGWKQMPDMARSLGRSLRVFKTEIKGLTNDDKARDEAEQQTAAQLPPPVAPPAIANAAPATNLSKPENVRTDAGSGAIAGDVARARPRPAPRPAHSDSAAGRK